MTNFNQAFTDAYVYREDIPPLPSQVSPDFGRMVEQHLRTLTLGLFLVGKGHDDEGGGGGGGGSTLSLTEGLNISLTITGKEWTETAEIATVQVPTFSDIYDTGITSQQVVFSGSSNLLSGNANLTWNGTTLTTYGLLVNADCVLRGSSIQDDLIL